MNKDRGLELGPGVTPMLRELREDLFCRNAEVFFVDNDSCSVEVLKRWHLPVVKADVYSLPFADNSFPLIFAKDLLGYSGKFLENGFSFFPFDFIKVAREWHRILAPRGKLVLVEISTPPQQEEIIRCFSDNDFCLKENNVGPDRVYDVFNFRGKIKSIYRDSYSLVFEKKV